jgi:myo-inositol-1(or 4)-monophosphatase
MPAYHDELLFARDLVVRAGDILLKYFRTGITVDMKAWADPVTVADRESEALIRWEIQKRFPADGIDGEEEGRRDRTSGRLWLVDPLDGTADFAGGLPIFSVVLSLVETSNPHQALLNVTYDPIRREMFHAVRGSGAFLDDRPIHVSARADLAGALIHLNYSIKPQIWAASVDLARRVTEVAPHARDLGSAAIALAYVASGRLDAKAKIQSGTYDIVGGNLLVTEAGGVVTDLKGQPWRDGGSLLAAAPGLHPLLLRRTADVEIPKGI